MRIHYALLVFSLWTVADAFSGRPALVPVQGMRTAALRRVSCTAPAEVPTYDLVGDGGVLKTTTRPGSGALAERGALVEVHYEGRLISTGAIFDSSRARGKTFKFTLGEGKVIGGWEVGVASMRVGEVATLTCSPQYAYGVKGIPPTIPPESTLQFDVELIGVTGAATSKNTFADDNPTAPRTPGAIAQAYQQKMAAKEAKSGGIDGFIEWAKSIYIFGLFSTPKGERPPWYLNPLITFPAIFLIVGLGFTLVVELGGLHRGDVAPIGDDLFDVLGELGEPPMDAL